MKGTRHLATAFTLVLLLALAAGSVLAQGPGTTGSASPNAQVGTTFTYQGSLNKNGTPVNDTCTMIFALYDDASAGMLIGDPLTLTVAVADGLFTAALDFGGTFQGDAYWLDVAVQCPGDAGFNTLTPRQALTAAPYALSLMPGAVISGTISMGRMLSVINNVTTLDLAVGLYGESTSRFYGYGVMGVASATDASWAAGVYGASSSPNSAGVYGRAPNEGVYGEASATAGATYGVYGRSDSTGGTGVYGYAAATSGTIYGVYGESASTTGGYGVYGYGHHGVYGRSDLTSGYGVHGWASATTGTTYGVYGKGESPNGWAGYFASSQGNGVHISAVTGKVGLEVAGGSKNAVVATADGARLLYSEESTAVWFSDYGFGQLQNGAATITIDPIFAQTVNLDEPYHIYLTAEGEEFVLLVVAAKSHTDFIVRGVTLDGKPAACTFDYRIVAVRRGFEGQRLERAPWADDDANLYPMVPTAAPGGE